VYVIFKDKTDTAGTDRSYHYEKSEFSLRMDKMPVRGIALSISTPLIGKEGRQHVIDISPEKEYDGKQCPEMEHNIKKNTRLMEPRKKTLNDYQMTGATDRKKFRQSLNNTQ
jgi:hypothetical protein